MTPNNAFSPLVVRCDWAKVKAGGLSSWRGWNKKWLILGESALKIYDKGSSSYNEIDLNLVTKIERIESSEEPYCLLVKTAGTRYYLSLENDKKLNNWLHDIRDSSLLGSSSAGTMVHQTYVNFDPSTGKFTGVPNHRRQQNSDTVTRKEDIVESWPHSQVSPEADTIHQRQPTTSHPPVNVSNAIQSPSGVVAPDEWFDDIVDVYAAPNSDPMHLRVTSRDKSDFASSKISQQLLRWDSTAVVEPRLDDQHFQHNNLTPHQHVYQNLFSLLIEVVSTDGQNKSLLDTLHGHLETLSTLDPVSSLVESQKYRVKLLQISSDISISKDPRVLGALLKDEAELTNLLRVVSTSKAGKKAVLSLKAGDAQCFLDLAQIVLNQTSLQSPKDRLFSLQVHKLLARLSKSCDRLPSSLFIKGVLLPEKEAVFGGSYGDIYQASYNGRAVALTRMEVFQRDGARPKFRQKFCRQALVWQHLKHPHVLPFIGIDSESFPSILCVVWPWMRYGTILEYLEDSGKGDIDTRLFEVAQGLAYLHSLHIIHGDLRGSNILIDDKQHVRLANFGLASFTDAATDPRTSSHKRSVRWLAPEIQELQLKGQVPFQRTAASDVYSFGCVCVEIYTGCPPFSEFPHNGTAALRAISGERPQRPSNDSGTCMSDGLWALVQSCWRQRDAERPSISSVVESMRQDVMNQIRF